MLVYVGKGFRQFRPVPYKPYPRKNWEFWSIIKGHAGIMLPEGPDILHHQTMWLCPPMHVHSWNGDPKEDTEVAVFQFTSFPYTIERLCHETDKGYLELPLNTAECLRLKALTEEASRHRANPTSATIICYQHVLSELSLLICEKCIKKGLPPSYDRIHQYIDKALEWYEQHMAEGPNLEDIAKAAAISAPHLRRMFYAAFNSSPRRIMDQLRFERATQLMGDPDIKLTEIAEACGFQSASAFSNAFKNMFGCSPAVWRGHYSARTPLM